MTGMSQQREAANIPARFFSLLNSSAVGYDEVTKRPFAECAQGRNRHRQAMTGSHAVLDGDIIRPEKMNFSGKREDGFYLPIEGRHIHDPGR